MNKTIARTSVIIALLCFSIGLPGQARANWPAAYYTAHPMTVEQLTEKWGKPVNVIAMDNGVEKMIFGPKDVVIGYTYFLTRDGRVIDRGVTSDTGKKSVAKDYTGPEPKGHMANYYKAHPMTVEQLTEKWGKPVFNHDYDNGIKKLTFGPKDPEIGYTYFLIRDGQVVDKNVTGAN